MICQKLIATGCGKNVVIIVGCSGIYEVSLSMCVCVSMVTQKNDPRFWKSKKKKFIAVVLITPRDFSPLFALPLFFLRGKMSDDNILMDVDGPEFLIEVNNEINDFRAHGNI